MEYLIYSIGIALIYLFCGIGLTFLLCPKRLEKYSFFFAPFVGLIYFSYIGMIFAYFTDLGSNSYSLFLFILPSIFLVLAIFVKKDQISDLIWPFQKENFLLLLLCITIFIAISLPFLIKINVLTTMTWANNDIAHYAAVSKFLTQSSFMQTSIFGESYFISLSQNAAHFAAYFSTAIPSSILGVDPYKIQNIVINLFYMFSIPIIYATSIEVFKYKKQIALITTFIISLSFHLIYINYNGFMGQILGMGIFLSLFLLTVYIIFNCKTVRNTIQYIPLATVFILGLVICYSPFLPLFYIPLLLFLILEVVYKKSFIINLPVIFYLIVSFFLTFLIAPFIIIRVINDFFIYNSVFGWSMPIINPLWAFGLDGYGFFVNSNSIMFWIFSIPIILITIFSMVSLYKEDRMLFNIAISYLVFFSIIYSYFMYKEFLSLSFTGESYKAYKLFTYLLPIIILSGLSYLRNFKFIPLSKMFPIRKLSKSYCLNLLIIIILITGNICSASTTIYINYNNGGVIDENIIELEKITKLDNVSSLNIEIPPFWDQMWAYYFLFMDKPIYLKYASYYPNSSLIGEWTLHQLNDEDIVNYIQTDKQIIKINDEFYLSQSNSSVKLSEGWYLLETDIEHNNFWRWTGLNNKDAKIILYSNENIKNLTIYFNFSSAEPNNNLTIIIDGIELADCPAERKDILYSCILNNITIPKGEHEILLKSKFPAKTLGTGDPRTLSYAFTNITFIENSENLN